MKRLRRMVANLFRSRFVWFVVGMAWLPWFKYMGRYTREPTALEAMGWVSHYQENKSMCNFIPDFSYSLRFPGDREKFEAFIRRMKLQDHKVSEDEYREGSGEAVRKATFSPEKKGFEIEFTAYQT